MSQVLDRIGRTHSARMAAHDAMLRHLDCDPGPEDALSLLGQLRATLMACGACQCPRNCVHWVGQGQAGVPAWCCGAEAFDALKAARDRLERTRTL